MHNDFCVRQQEWIFALAIVKIKIEDKLHFIKYMISTRFGKSGETEVTSSLSWIWSN